jgi:hypothetical protein
VVMGTCSSNGGCSRLRTSCKWHRRPKELISRTDDGDFVWDPGLKCVICKSNHCKHTAVNILNHDNTRLLASSNPIPNLMLQATDKLPVKGPAQLKTTQESTAPAASATSPANSPKHPARAHQTLASHLKLPRQILHLLLHFSSTTHPALRKQAR